MKYGSLGHLIVQLSKSGPECIRYWYLLYSLPFLGDLTLKLCEGLLSHLSRNLSFKLDPRFLSIFVPSAIIDQLLFAVLSVAMEYTITQLFINGVSKTFTDITHYGTVQNLIFQSVNTLTASIRNPILHFSICQNVV